MIKKRTILAFLVIGLCMCACQTDEANAVQQKDSGKDELAQPKHNHLNWQAFDQTTFDKADSAQKLVLLDVGANWCHWCHVMDDSTYSNSEVIDYLSTYFIIAKEDQDSRPDLYAAYKKYGWPATIVFNAQGQELLQLTGYQNPNEFLRALKKVVANPVVQEPEISDFKTGSEDLNIDKLTCRLFESLDFEKGGHNWFQKSLIEGTVEFVIAKAKSSDNLKRWLDITIKNSYNLVDPVWGGVYQYSTRRSWTSQHYEKLLKIQARYIKLYTLYGSKYQNEEAISQAVKIADYCFNFLSNGGPMFSNSQNADLISGVHSSGYYLKDSVERMKMGVPSIDQSQYTKENAQLAEAFIYLWAATGVDKYKERSIEITDYLLENRLKEDLVVRKEQAEKFWSLADNQAFLELLIASYELTQNQVYLNQAKKTALKMMAVFYDDQKGLMSVAGELVVPASPEFTTVAKTALTFNKLGHIKSNSDILTMSRTLFKTINQVKHQKNGGKIPYLLSLNDQLYREPFHAELLSENLSQPMTPDQIQMLQSVLLSPDQYVLFERTDLSNLPEEKDFLSPFEGGTMFFCTSNTCSSPMESDAEVSAFLRSLIDSGRDYECLEHKPEALQ